MRNRITGWISVTLLFTTPSIKGAVTNISSPKSVAPLRISAPCLPNKDQCSHQVGRLWFTITNYGLLGSQLDPTVRNCINGLAAPSAQFPGGSNIEHLFQGAPWVGAIVNGDTLVSIGTEGWVYDAYRGELHAECEAEGVIIRRSSNPSNPFYSMDALSDMDFIATMFDTLTDPQFVENPDPQDGKPFRPLGLKVEQTSFSYTGALLEDILFIHYKLENIRQNTLTDAFFGIFWDGDVGHQSTPNFFQDDWAGLFQIDTVIDGHPLHVEIPFVADNDGDPASGTFGSTSPTGIVGLYLLSSLIPFSKTSFNWWTPNGTVALDWGPQKAPGRRNFSGGWGQPEGDGMRYYYLSNGEKDYDQVRAAMNQTADGWIPPLASQANAIDVANGFDARYLYSFGPFNLAPSETVSFSIAVLAGSSFHQNPFNFSQNLGSTAANYLDTTKIKNYLQGLDFSGLISKALAARQKAGIVLTFRGDINGDFLLTIADVVSLINMTFLNNPPPNLSLHDLNCDGEVSPADVVLLLNLVFLENSLPC